MPRQPVEHFYSEKELQEMVNRINAFASDYSPWKFTQARKEHEDLFGEVIKPGASAHGAVALGGKGAVQDGTMNRDEADDKQNQRQPFAPDDKERFSHALSEFEQSGRSSIECNRCRSVISFHRVGTATTHCCRCGKFTGTLRGL
jgi:hypothetical protein